MFAQPEFLDRKASITFETVELQFQLNVTIFSTER